MPEGQEVESQAPGLQRHPARAGTFGAQTAGEPAPAESTPIAQEAAAASSTVDEATKARVEQARANKGEQAVSSVDGEALKAQLGKSGTQACEDCA